MSGFFLANPGGLWALAALAAVAVLYLFYRRHRPQAVTGLFLWGVPRLGTAGGRRPEPPRLGRALLLDLAAAALFALALAGPAWRSASGGRVAIVLDDSFSMRARNCRAEAAKLAGRLLAEAESGGAAILLAGETPSVLAGPGADSAELRRALDGYLPSAEKADLQAAVNLARDLYGAAPSVRVITNRDDGLPVAAGGDLAVHVLPGRGGNVALTRLWRERDAGEAGRETLTLAAANYSDSAADVALRIELWKQAASGEVFSERMHLAPGKTEFAEIRLSSMEKEILLVRLAAPPETDVIADDSLAFVPPVPDRTVTYGVKDLGGETARFFRLGLEAAGCLPVPAAPDGGAAAPDLSVTGNPEVRGRALTLRIPKPSEPGVFAPPLVVDLASPFCRDVDLAGIPWVAADRNIPAAPERIFVLAGDTPLFWQTAPGLLDCNLWPERSRMVREPAWPAFCANLAAAAADRLPGLGATLYRPRDILRRRPETGAESQAIRLFAGPDEVASSPSGREFALPANAGLYELRGPEGVRHLAVLPFYGKASDTANLARTERVVVSEGMREEGGPGAADLTWLALLPGLFALGLNWRLGRK